MKIKLEIENDYGLFKANNCNEEEYLKFYDSDGELLKLLMRAMLLQKKWMIFIWLQQIRIRIMWLLAWQNCFIIRGLKLLECFVEVIWTVCMNCTRHTAESL